MRFWLSAVLVCSLSVSAAEPDRTAWGKAVLAELQKLEPKVKLSFDEKKFELQSDDGDLRGTIVLVNYYAEGVAAGSTPAEVARRIHGNRADSKVLAILPSLKERVTVEVEGNLRMRLGGWAKNEKPSTDAAVYQPVGEDLALVLVEDHAQSMTWVSKHGLEEKKTTFEALLAKSTPGLLKRPPPKTSAVGAGAWRFQGDEYATAQFLLGDLQKTVKVKGAPVAMFLFRETVLLTGEDDEAGLQALVDTARAEREKPRAWMPRFLRWSGTRWEPYAPKSPSKDVRDLLLFGRVEDYGEQTELLRAYSDALPEGPSQHDEDAFAAKVSAVESKKGTPLTLAVLTEGQDTILPEVQYVDLMRWVDEKPKHAGVVSFEKLKATLGKGMVKTALWPPRWRVKTFPTEAQLKQLAPSMDLPE